MTKAPTFFDAMELLWREAELLDRRDYDAWLDLWSEDGLYVVPIERDGDDFVDRLNYVYDDHRMRAMRVARLKGRYSISARGAGVTVRTVSRFVFADLRAEELDVRAAQHVVEHRRGETRILAADLEATVRATEKGVVLTRKVVRLANSEDALTGVGYLL